ncbi:uncharacterized protein BHQ10_001236 [Talaromyces amestolkiae]|uniref:Zn(2)-C6 fungal-type domain-containing protein n=1 Tax=Talaromyces amestolkiae TaxID=1196081 RepID=A0A364KNU6_TALAM|nr:uncharacterized protein BHQ10_001236 [Talaromyces amestolkiae]RAO65224.1 hypothetical protein BHQ10_001236 [Talaromyces amestolkiae]
MTSTTPAVKRRACVACTIAKAKCTPQTVNMCQRCARLGKSCTYLDIPQTKRKHRAAPSRVELLEKKVEQLKSQLAVLTRQNGQTLPETFTPLTDNDLGSSRTSDLDSADISTLLEVAKDPAHGIHPPTSSVLSGQLSIVERGLMSEAEAERLVATYRLEFVHRFPFVLLAPSETAPDINPDEHRALLGTYRLSNSLSYSLGRPTGIEHDSRIDERIASLEYMEHLSDRCITPFIRLQSFVTTMDEVYASVQASGGRTAVQVIRNSLQRQFDSMRALVEVDLSSCPSSTGNTVLIEIKRAEMRLDELSLREKLWNTEPASPVRIAMLIGIIQRSRELIHMIRNLPSSEIDHLTVSTSANLCAAIGYMPIAVLSLVNLISTSSVDSAIEAQVQAVADVAEYPSIVTELANTLEMKFEGMSAADKEADIVGSICTKMRLLARCYPYQIRAIGGNKHLSQDARQHTSTMAVDANEGIMTQAWPSIYGDLDDIFPIDDIQWDQLLSDFTGFS